MSSTLSEKENEKEIEKFNDSTIKDNETIIVLKLGDIIRISSPLNEKLDNQEFIIDYIDKTKTYLINTNTFEKIKLKISEDHVIGNGDISQIIILSTNDTDSYAKQNNLLPGTWINIYFGGDFPVIITGEITNLEEDMIEITTADGDVIYINFNFKGIPEDLPIENIEIREKPQEQIKEIPREEESDENIEYPELEKEEKEHEFIQTEKIQFAVPIKNIKDQLREFILKADQIKFGDEEFGPIVQYVDVSTKSQRYSIETQVSDLLDELLSTIPSTQRTPRVLNNIHTMIQRFKQLREKFSYFDEYGNIESILINESNYRPLTQYFTNFKLNLFWILPIVKNIKKVYNTVIDSENSDLVNINITTDIQNISRIFDTYKSNTSSVDQNKYSLLFNELNPYFTPFDLINEESVNDILIEKNVNSDINVIIDNLEEMYSSVFTHNNIRSRRFIIQKYNLGLTKLDTLESTGSKLITARVKMTNPDTMSIKSIMTLPEPAIRFSKINLPGTTLLDKANLNLVFLNYWEFLKKKTNVNNVIIDSLDNEIEFDENNFVNNTISKKINSNSNSKVQSLAQD